MSVRGVEIKVGDKLRYLGGVPTNEGEVIRGRVYDVVDIDYDVIVIDTIDNGSWAIGDEYKNVDCFEKVEEKGNDKTTLDHSANLALRVVQLERAVKRLSDMLIKHDVDIHRLKHETEYLDETWRSTREVQLAMSDELEAIKCEK